MSARVHLKDGSWHEVTAYPSEVNEDWMRALDAELPSHRIKEYELIGTRRRTITIDLTDVSWVQEGF